VLCTGFFDDEKEKPEDYRKRFTELIARKLTLLCVNPDIVVQRGEKLIYCAGALARLYEQMGGKTEYYGKPHLPIFAAALTRARDVGRAVRPLVIGDGLETDIKGANTAGLDALFVMDGIFAAEISDKRNVAAIAKLLNAKGVTARGAIEALRW
jgi:HAD superfamily hydrolase (TIGR01459 family)